MIELLYTTHQIKDMTSQEKNILFITFIKFNIYYIFKELKMILQIVFESYVESLH